MKIPATLQTGIDRFKQASRPAQAGMTAAGLLSIFVLFNLMGGGADNSFSGPTFVAREGKLDIVVREGGNIEALQSQQIRSAIRGGSGVKILSIVEEGYRVTAEDVTAGKILVELDSSQLNEQKLNQQIAYETADATFIERKAQLEIRINQNVANLNAASQRMRFARLDLEKFLGANVVQDLVNRLAIEERLARTQAAQAAATGTTTDRDARVGQIQQNREATRQQGRNGGARGSFDPASFDPSDLSALPAPMRERIEQMMAQNNGEIPAEFLARMRAGGGRPVPGGADDDASTLVRVEDSSDGPSDTEPEVIGLAGSDAIALPPATEMLMDNAYLSLREAIDFRIYASENRLEDGMAKQQLRTLQEAVRVAEENNLQAQARYAGQERLAARDFITPNELEAERSRLLQAESRLEQAITDLNLYTQYTFIKDADQQLANYEDAIMSYQRTQAEAAAELAQAEARYKSAVQRLELEAQRLADLNEQLAMTVIRAQRPGLVVYGSADTGQPFRGGNQEPIQEGATVRERQAILTIPDMTEMAVRVNIHESSVQRVAEGQTVSVRIDAFPDMRLTGQVIKVAVVADSGNAFMNPDLKVYPTIVRIDGEHDWLRPGMTAEVEILVASLENAVYVPIQAVTYLEDKQVVYVSGAGRREAREVQTGNYSEQFIEITAGLRSGEEVMLLPPRQSSQIAGQAAS
ncbi:HlyD family efflux transporter periplasmic adaptor subunit [Gammaproteobacteria bacterium LSUCC0112]|nr:HlyD family efflux transporter periplasmic adaptor subunit [Gammaproteobacteria bacterium LSUCC0112]